MLCPFFKDSRSKRECALVSEMGWDVTVIDLYDPSNRVPNEYGHITNEIIIEGGIVKRLFKFLKLVSKLRTHNFDVISAYDISALFIAWIMNIGKPKGNKSKLVYDAHEFEIGRMTNRSRLTSKIIVFLEGFLMKRVSGSIVVNKTIASEMAKYHKLSITPTVVRSCANLINLDPQEILVNKAKLSKQLGFNPDNKIIMYHGVVQEGRGIEQSIRVIKNFTNTILFILGSGSEEYFESLHLLIKQYGVENKVFFHEAVPNDELWKYVGISDLGLINIQNYSKSYFYCLPNKLFENIQAGNVVVGSDFPELRKIILGYEIGEVFQSDNDEEFINVINSILYNPVKYCKLKSNVLKARLELNWENEKTHLFNFYNNIVNNYDKYKNM